MAIISNGTTVASGGTVRGSASNLSNIPSPSNSQILSGVASASAGATGSYAFLVYDNGSTTNQGTTSSSSLNYGNAEGQTGNGTSGTWRQMGYRTASTNERRSTVWLRIS